VPTYNRAVLLRHTLDSLVRQKMPRGSYEVIVVDDGSSDGTAEVVDEYRSRLDLSYYYQEDEGYRAAAARNIGIRHARAGICVFVDSGVILDSGCLAAYIDRHRRSAEPIAVCGYVYGFNQDEDGAEIMASVNFADPDATIADMAAQGKWPDIREWFYAKYGDDFSGLPAPWLIYWTCNVSADTSQLKAIGMFDEQYRSWGAEDVDLGYRLHRHGVRFVLDREARALHLPHAKNFEDHARSAADNIRYFADKYNTPITRLLVGNDPFVINDIIAERQIPDCAEYESDMGRDGSRFSTSAKR
jgi:glycosyltransferase involved in cell wall biosynthesis